MLIPIASVLIGFMVIVIPFMVMFLLIKKFIKKEENKSDLELRIQILESEVESLKEQIRFIDEM